MKKYDTVQDIIEDVHRRIIADWTDDAKDSFFSSVWDGTNLTEYHMTLGMWIRNNYRLWEIPWTPEIREDGADYSPYHPDQVSFTIIEEVWKMGMEK